jgi:hypothetical protein
VDGGHAVILPWGDYYSMTRGGGKSKEWGGGTECDGT